MRWDEDIRRAEPAFRAAWKVNVFSLDFRTVTLITLAAMLGLSLFVAAVMPPRPRRTRETDALEFALVTLLTVIFSPLSFNYAYVWLMYPTALALHRVLGDPSDPRPRRRLAAAWLAAVLFIPALAIAMPQGAQACGNLFVPALLLVFGLGWMLRAEGRRPPGMVTNPRRPTPRIATSAAFSRTRVSPRASRPGRSLCQLPRRAVVDDRADAAISSGTRSPSCPTGRTSVPGSRRGGRSRPRGRRRVSLRSRSTRPATAARRPSGRRAWPSRSW